MRTTVTLEDDVVAALDGLRQTQGLRTSEAVNLLVRRGLATVASPPPPFVQRGSALGEPLIPIDDIGAVLEYLDEVEGR